MPSTLSFTPSATGSSNAFASSSVDYLSLAPPSATTVGISYVPTATSFLGDGVAETDTITVDLSISGTDGESKVKSIHRRVPKGIKIKGPKKPSRADKKAKREKTDFGDSFVRRFNTLRTTEQIRILRDPRVARAKREEDPRRAILQELLDLLQEVLQYKKGDDGRYKTLEESLLLAVAPEGTPVNDNNVFGLVQAYDATLAWLDGEDESTASIPDMGTGSLIVDAGALAYTFMR